MLKSSNDWADFIEHFKKKYALLNTNTDYPNYKIYHKILYFIYDQIYRTNKKTQKIISKSQRKLKSSPFCTYSMLFAKLQNLLFDLKCNDRQSKKEKVATLRQKLLIIKLMEKIIPFKMIFVNFPQILAKGLKFHCIEFPQYVSNSRLIKIPVTFLWSTTHLIPWLILGNKFIKGSEFTKEEYIAFGLVSGLSAVYMSINTISKIEMVISANKILNKHEKETLEELAKLEN